MSGITYSWQPQHTPYTRVDPVLIQHKAEYETLMQNGNYSAIIESPGLFFAGAHRTFSKWDPFHTQDQMGYSLKDPIEKIRQLVRPSDFSFCIAAKRHLFIKENTPEIRCSHQENCLYIPTKDPEGCGPPRVVTALCPEKDQTLLIVIIPDLFAQIGASASITREHRNLSIDGHEAFAPVDVVSVHWK